MNKETKDSREYLENSLFNMGKEILTQDNLATNLPIFYVQEKKRHYGLDTQWADDSNTVWLSSDGDELDEQEFKELEEQYEQTGDDFINECQRTAFIETWEFVQPFFTRKAAQKYIDGNKHNLKHPRIYVASGYRNHEWEVVRRYAANLVNKE